MNNNIVHMMYYFLSVGKAFGRSFYYR